MRVFSLPARSLAVVCSVAAALALSAPGGSHARSIRPSRSSFVTRAPRRPLARASAVHAESEAAAASAAKTTPPEAAAGWTEKEITVVHGDEAVAPQPDDHAAWFLGILPEAPEASAGDVDLSHLRTAGMAELRRLCDGGLLPSSKAEAWRQIGVRDLYAMTFGPPASTTVDAECLPPVVVGAAADAVAHAVFVDGVFSEALSDVGSLPDGLVVGGLGFVDEATAAAALESLAQSPAESNTLGLEDGSVEGALGAGPQWALNQASLRDAAVVSVAEGVRVDGSVVVSFVTTAADPTSDSTALSSSHPRLVVHAAADSALNLVVVHADAQSVHHGGLTNAVSQVHVGSGASVSHTTAIARGATAAHLDVMEANVDEGAAYVPTVLQVRTGPQPAPEGGRGCRAGAEGRPRALRPRWPATLTCGVGCASQGPSAFCRVALGASFRGSGASVTARGLVVSGGPSPSTVGIHTAFRHLVEGCTSDQVQKILVADKGKGCFRGLIRANGEALQTKADQLCRSMLLTDGAKVHVAPCLEIIADDVECTHGATVADLDEEKVFYFRARGISAEAARAAMVRGFATDVLGDVPSEVGPCVPGRSRAAAHRVP